MVRAKQYAIVNLAFHHPADLVRPPLGRPSLSIEVLHPQRFNRAIRSDQRTLLSMATTFSCCPGVSVSNAARLSTKPEQNTQGLVINGASEITVTQAHQINAAAIQSHPDPISPSCTPITTTVDTSVPKKTFYRRSLPDTCVAFSSKLGRNYFESAMRHRGLKSYFHLMEQYTTQSEPAFCGISTLVIALNALAVDPRRIWKGSWRWYEESMLNCCIDLEQAKETGITMPVRFPLHYFYVFTSLYTYIVCVCPAR
jgi:Phytochelatin synthase